MNYITGNVKKNILVLGQGFIGRFLSQFLSSDENLEVHNVTSEHLNYFNKDEILDFFDDYSEQGCNFDYVINCVGYGGENNIDDLIYFKDKARRYNSDLPLIIATALSQLNDIPLIHLSSGDLYINKPVKNQNNERVNFNSFAKGLEGNGIGSVDRSGWYESDEPNYGILNESPIYNKFKHVAELALTSGAFKNIYNLRIRLPISYYFHRKNLLLKLIRYKEIVDHENSVTFLPDLFNFIYSIIINRLPAGIYNVVNDGLLKNKTVIDIFKKYYPRLKEAGIKCHHPNEIIIHKDNEFGGKTVEKRSETILNNQIFKEQCGFVPQIIDENLIETCFEQIIKDKIEYTELIYTNPELIESDRIDNGVTRYWNNVHKFYPS
jgi:hypothetical protein